MCTEGVPRSNSAPRRRGEERGKVIKVKGLIMLKLICLLLVSATAGQSFADGPREIKLPEPAKDGSLSLEKALKQRRSVRSYLSEPISLEELSQLLWAAQGITKRMDKPAHWPEEREWFGGLRTAPSAGALYPLEIYVASGRVSGLDAGLYKYIPEKHSLVPQSGEDLRDHLAEAALGQSYVRECAADIIITAVYQRVEGKYGKRADLYVPMEAGSAVQNIYLQCEPLGLGTVVIGAFSEDRVKDALELPGSERPMAIMPVGRKKK
ncbi:MAG: SagB/ThcOx family dehydrogenase [Candidatus Krumholzibacteriota bacterium]|nr:SagB/ThcOx family dehydrogenase [Candidatus Krumholzibacteriota bacterium]